MELLWSLWVEGLPVAEKTYLFKEVYIEIIIKKPEKVGEKGRSFNFSATSWV